MGEEDRVDRAKSLRVDFLRPSRPLSGPDRINHSGDERAQAAVVFGPERYQTSLLFAVVQYDIVVFVNNTTILIIYGVYDNSRCDIISGAA